jgi:hypothetical protein
MNAISLIYRYKRIKEMSPEERKQVVPRVCVFGGKAASAYYMAKKIVGLILSLGDTINNDPDVGDLLKASWQRLRGGAEGASGCRWLPATAPHAPVRPHFCPCSLPFHVLRKALTSGASPPPSRSCSCPTTTSPQPR